MHLQRFRPLVFRLLVFRISFAHTVWVYMPALTRIVFNSTHTHTHAENCSTRRIQCKSSRSISGFSYRPRSVCNTTRRPSTQRNEKASVCTKMCRTLSNIDTSRRIHCNHNYGMFGAGSQSWRVRTIGLVNEYECARFWLLRQKLILPYSYWTGPSSPDGESPSEGESSGSSQNPAAEGSRINRNQLEAALSLATSANLPATATTAHASSASVTAATAAAQSTQPPTSASRSNVAESVLRDFFTNVLSGARSSGSGAASTESSTAATEPQQQLYTGQLQTMLEIGLTDEAINLQALILCNGDVEAAINFVMLSNS